MRRLLRLGLIFAAAVLLSAGVVVWLDARAMDEFGEGQSLEPSDAPGIVLGAGIDPDGVLGWSSRRRVALAVALLKEGKVGYLVCSGGAAWFGRLVHVGETMRDYAIALGAPPDHVIAENRATSTFENLRYAREILEKRGMDGAPVLITDALHLTRSRALAWHLGIELSGSAAVDGLAYRLTQEWVVDVGRETLAWWHNVGRAAYWSVLGLFGVEEAARERLLIRVN